MRKAKFIFPLALLSCTFLVSACEPLLSQNPADTFWNKKFPKQLEWIRSQMREIPLKVQEKIVDRVLKDQQRKDLLKVAVIDSGVDIAHPDLLNQIAYRVQDGHIVGAGYDIMGQGAFGSHVLVDPTLFAFGAESLRDGRIVNPPESPLKELEMMNNRFRDLVMEGIQKDPVLKASLFSKLSRDSFTMLGFEYVKDDPEGYYKSYERLKEKGELINASTIANEFSKNRVLAVQNKWSMMTKDHKPKALSYIESIEAADHFVKLLADAYNTLDTEMDFTKKVSLLNQFQNIVQKKEDIMEDAEKFPDLLKKAMEFVIYGADAYDPILSLERMFQTTDEYEKLPFAEALHKFHGTKKQELDAYLKRTDLLKAEKAELEKYKKQIQTLGNIFENLIGLQKDPVAYNKMRSELRRYVYRTKHPYIAAESNGNSHATHVSGVIAKQHPNIRIVPIRVTTQTIVTSKDRQKDVVNYLLSEFEKFRETSYFEPLNQELIREYGGIKVSDKNIVAGAKRYLKENSLNAIFIQDVLNAVEVAGKEQIKLANVSLGTTFQKNHSLDKKMESLAEDMFSEFARYQIGKTIQEKAPGTLFMIATGNDGGWVDGVSKTAFPVGITSLRLMKISKELNLPASPNNDIKNVLAVASINPNGTLTPFTNILLDPNIPEIFSTGEEIKSSIPAKALTATSELIHKKLEPLKQLLVRMTSVLIRKNKNSSMEETEKRLEESELDIDFMEKLPESVSLLLHMQEPITRANMSGTSMATPTVTGIVARYVAEKMKKENITMDEVYLHPSFKPETIIKDIMAMSKSNSLTPMITVKMLVEGIKTWEKSRGEITQKKAFNLMMKARCESIFVN